MTSTCTNTQSRLLLIQSLLTTGFTEKQRLLLSVAVSLGPVATL